MTHLNDKELDKEFDEFWKKFAPHKTSLCQISHKWPELKEFINTHYISKKVVEEIRNIYWDWNPAKGKNTYAQGGFDALTHLLQALTKKEEK